WEFRGLSDKMGSRAPGWLLFPLGAFFAFSGTVLRQVDVALVLSLALVAGLGAFLVVPGRRQGLGRWAMGVAGALYIGMPFNYYLLLYTSKPHGLEWTLFTIFAVIACDAAALLVGSRIGRHPFFTTISPRKTVEGAPRQRAHPRRHRLDRTAGARRHRPQSLAAATVRPHRGPPLGPAHRRPHDPGPGRRQRFRRQGRGHGHRSAVRPGAGRHPRR